MYHEKILIISVLTILHPCSHVSIIDCTYIKDSKDSDKSLTKLVINWTLDDELG